MKVNGIGNVTKKELTSILTKEGLLSVKDGSLTMAQLACMYKYEMARKNSIIGSCEGTFRINFDRIPEEIIDKLSPQEIGKLVDSFYKCYGDGKNGKSTC